MTVQSQTKPTPSSSFDQQVEELGGTLDSISILLKDIFTHDCLKRRSGDTFSYTQPDGSTLYVHKPCKRLECTSCGPTAARRYVELIHNGILTNRLTYWVTLTHAHDPGWVNPARLKKKLTSLIRAYNDEFHTKLSYIWVLGGTTYEGLHFHLLVDQPIPVDWLKKAWQKRTGAYVVYVVPFPAADAVRLATYAVRNYLQSYRLKLGRHVSSSRDVDLRLHHRRTEPSGWDYHPGLSIHTVRQMYGSDRVPGRSSHAI